MGVCVYTSFHYLHQSFAPLQPKLALCKYFYHPDELIVSLAGVLAFTMLSTTFTEILLLSCIYVLILIYIYIYGIYILVFNYIYIILCAC